MRKLTLALAVALAAVGLAVVGPSPVDAQATTDVYPVHGLNLNGQTVQGDGGTNVTVCLGDTDPALIPDFQFGQVGGPVPVATGSSVTIKVWLQDTPGTPVDCTDGTGGTQVIDQTIPEVPAGPVALVATQGPQSQGPELLPIALNDECADPGTGRLTGVHAANAGTVDVLVDGDPVTQLAYGEKAGDESPIPVDTYSLQVDLGGNPIVGPVDVPVSEGVNRIVYVVGNQPGAATTPVVSLLQDLAIPVCDVPVEPEPEPAAEPAAEPVAAEPTFTG